MKKAKLILRLVLCAALAAGLVWLGIRYLQSRESKQDYEEAKTLTAPTPAAATPKPTPKPTNITYTDPEIDALMKLDLAPLIAENEDVIGWIHIPDTIISYPIIQGEDNDFYLRRSWKMNKSTAGTIFMEYQNSADFSDFNTILYGHNMHDDTMFGTLEEYADLTYWQEHPYIYIVTQTGIFRYDIFAMHKVRLNTVVYGMKLESDAQRQEFLSFALDYSAIDTGIEPTVEDHILTLSTCSGSKKNRWVVQAVKNETECFLREQ